MSPAELAIAAGFIGVIAGMLLGLLIRDQQSDSAYDDGYDAGYEKAETFYTAQPITDDEWERAASVLGLDAPPDEVA